MLGRSGARAQLAEAVERARAGSGSFVWISGDAGIGKTSLLDEVATGAAGDGLQVLRGTAWDSPGTPPFWLWVQVLRDAVATTPADVRQAWGPRAAEALALLPEEGGARHGRGRTTDEHDRFALFDSVEGVLRAIAARRPVLLALDDLHWTDAGSLRLLQFVTRVPAAAPIAVVGTWRDAEPVGSSVAAVAAELVAHAERIELHGLEPPAVGELVLRTAGIELTEVEADALRARTGGNPLFVGEVARLARDRGTRDLSAIVPDSARAIIGRRLARASQACHEVLAVAAVAGGANDVDTVARLTGRDLAGVTAVLDEAAAAGLARADSSRIEIAHPLIRECLVATLAPARARQIHLAAADLAADDPSAAAEVAHHLVAALPLSPLPRVRAALARAAEAAWTSRAYEEAARHRGTLVELAAPGSQERYDALTARGTALLAAGAVEDARDDFVQAASIARGRGDATGFAGAALGFAAGMSGFEIRLRDPAQIALLEEALAMLGDEESAVRADVMARLSVALSYEGVAERRARLADEAVAIARRVGAPRSVAHALAAHCDAIAGPDDAERRVAEASEVIDLARAAGDRGLEMLGRRLRIVAELELGEVAAARADIAAFDAEALSLAQPLYRCYASIFRGFLAHLDGDFAAMERHAAETERLGELAGSGNAAVLAASNRGWIALEAGRPEGFLAQFADMLGVVDQLGPNGHAVTALMPGQPDVVRAGVVPFVAEVVAGLARDAEYVSTLCVVASGIQGHGGPVGAAPALREALAPYAGRFAVDGIAAAAAGPVDHWLGYLALATGDVRGAIGHLEQSLETAERIGARPHAANSRALLAEALARRAEPGDAERAARLAAEARDAYLAMGLSARAEAVATVSAPQGALTPSPATGTLRRDGDVWTVDFRGSSAAVPHVKGMTDLAVLVRSPRHEVHVLDLAGGGGPRQGSTGPVLDDVAKAAYRDRIARLDEDLAAADATGDAEAFTRAESERAFILAELGAAYGLGGRARRTGDDAERARSAVTWRLRDAIKRVERAHPEAGAHLRRAVRTGAFCVYDPDGDVAWEVHGLTT